MLRRLRLDQFVIVDSAEIEFGPALNAVTGETGTGKSIVIDAIGFLAGGRGDAGWIRAGANGLAVEGSFEVERLPEAMAVAARLGCPAQDGQLIVRRELSAAGRARAVVQGRNIRQGELRELGEQLLAIHGQGEHRRLLDPVVQLDLVDRFAGALVPRGRYAAARARWLEAAREVEQARARLDELADKEEWHRFQFDEIDAARITPGEEERLRAAREDLAGRQRSIEVRGELTGLLFEDEGSALERIESALHRLSGLGEEWRGLRGEIEAAREALKRARRGVPVGVPDEEETGLDTVEARLVLLARLKKKYGPTEEAILERRERLASLLDETDRLRGRMEALTGEVAVAARAAADAAVNLRKVRAARGIGAGQGRDRRTARPRHGGSRPGSRFGGGRSVRGGYAVDRRTFGPQLCGRVRSWVVPSAAQSRRRIGSSGGGRLGRRVVP